MPVRAVYNPRCDNCDLDSLVYGTTIQAAQTKVQRRGWSIYPLLCKGCADALKKKVRARREQQGRWSVREPREGA